MESIEYATPVSGEPRARKRAVDKSNWKREIEKSKRYTMKNPPKMPSCTHTGTSFKCHTLRGSDALSFAKSFFNSGNKIEQDAFIVAHTRIVPPVRTDRKKSGVRTTARSFAMNHFIRKSDGSLIRVCQKVFTDVLNIKVYRLRGVCRRHFLSRTLPTETRGGNRKSTKFAEKRSNIKNFISKFKVLEVHYCRFRTGRQYLPSDLSINKLHKLYNQETPEPLRVKPSYFRFIFNTHFNIGFKTPATDLCSTCLMYTEQLKTEKNSTKKNEILIKTRVHTLRAKSFFHFAKEENDRMITLSFDCQKNMVLPKVADQAAYYSRQFYLYNFGIVQGSSKSNLSKENVFLYIWTENERPKGSNEIASALYHRLGQTNFANKSVVRLICDGCGAQNKNSALMGMLSKWLHSDAPIHIKQIQIIFPVPGHSFIPPDRVFALLEKRVKSKGQIIKPEEYLGIYEEYGQIIRLGSESCPVYDWKTGVAEIIKPPGQWHFQFNQAKRFILSRGKNGVLVRGELHYRSDMASAKSVIKKGRKISNLKLNMLSNGVPVKSAKKEDVNKLLSKHFGNDWKGKEDLSFYKNIINTSHEMTINEDEGNEECVHLDENVDLRI